MLPFFFAVKSQIWLLIPLINKNLFYLGLIILNLSSAFLLFIFAPLITVGSDPPLIRYMGIILAFPLSGFMAGIPVLYIVSYQAIKSQRDKDTFIIFSGSTPVLIFILILSI